jgi:hypothetical protein
MKAFFISILSALWVAAAVVADGSDVVDPSEVVAGSRGVCLTEMDGGEMVEIPITVLGTVGPYAPDQEMVLIRLDDERFEKTGIIAGMSGSPVYVDGRLLGALAFGWGFAVEPIGGVTPFSRMEGLASSDGGGGSSASASRPDLETLVAARQTGRLGRTLLDWLAPEPAGAVRQLPLALSVAGPAGPGAGWIGEFWDRQGWVAGPPAGGSDQGSSGPLRPGAMVSAVLVDGDVTLGAGGTVTEVRGDQVWAFGHPFLRGGNVRIPLARAGVVTVLPSLLNSFKFFTVGDRIGAIETDRAHGVWGRLGPTVPMVPMSVEVNGAEYRFRSIRHEQLLPALVAYLTQSSLEVRGRVLGSQTVSLRLALDYSDGLEARLEETFVGADAGLQAANMVAAATGYLENSSFEVPELKAIRVALGADEAIEAAELVSVTPDRRVVAPGELLKLRLRVRPHRGSEYFRTVVRRVPDGVAEGRIDLVVADGAAWSLYDLQMRPPRPGSFADEVDLFRRLVPSDRLVIAFERHEVGVAMPGGPLALPPSLAVQMRSALGGTLQTTEYTVVDSVTEDMPTPIAAAERIRLTVRAEQWEDR